MRYSAGGVIINKQTGKVALVNQFGKSWCFPKGAIEEGESEFDAASREIFEETGLTSLDLVKALGSYQRTTVVGFRQPAGPRLEEKKITLFLFQTNQNQLNPRVDEVTQAVWLDKDEVAKKLSHPKDREFFKSIQINL